MNKYIVKFLFLLTMIVGLTLSAAAQKPKKEKKERKRPKPPKIIVPKKKQPKKKKKKNMTFAEFVAIREVSRLS